MRHPSHHQDCKSSISCLVWWELRCGSQKPKAPTRPQTSIGTRVTSCCLTLGSQLPSLESQGLYGEWQIFTRHPHFGSDCKVAMICDYSCLDRCHSLQRAAGSWVAFKGHHPHFSLLPVIGSSQPLEKTSAMSLSPLAEKATSSLSHCHWEVNQVLACCRSLACVLIVFCFQI